MLTELNEVLDRLKQGPSQQPQRIETSDTSGDEADTSKVRRIIPSKKTFRVKKKYAATELGRFCVTGPSDAANMPSHFYSRVCRRNVFLLTYGHHEVLRHFQGSRHFARDQRVRLETPGLRVLDFHGNPLGDDELERQRGKIRKGPFVVRDHKHPFVEDLITDETGAVDPQLPVLTKASCLVDSLRTGGSYELIEKLWAQFVLTAGPVSTEVGCIRDEVLVGSVNFGNHFVSFPIYLAALLLVNPLNRNATRILSRVVGCAKSHHLYSLEFEERGITLWAFIRTWGKTLFIGLPWPLQTVFSTLPHRICRCLGQLWLLWVVRRPLLLFLVGGM